MIQKYFPFKAGMCITLSIGGVMPYMVRINKRGKVFITMDNGRRAKIYTANYINPDRGINVKYEVAWIKTIYGEAKIMSLPLFPWAEN